MFKNNVKYIFSTIKSSFIPAICFALGLLGFYAYYPYEQSSDYVLHYAFYSIAFISLGILYFVNRSKPFLTIMTGTVCYILLNKLKISLGANFNESAEYLWLCFLLPLNLAVFYFLPAGEIKNIRNFYLLLISLAEVVFVQKFGSFILQIPHIDIRFASMPMWAVIAWILFLVPMALDMSFRSTIVNTGLFYADMSLFFGLMYADTVSACTTFFFVFALILCLTAFLNLHHLYRYDYLEGVGSYQSYLAQAKSKFPFKYTIGLLCIDNCDKIFEKTGKAKFRVLEQLIADKIKEFSYDIDVFRHQKNELILVFKNETAKQVMDYAEEIRRSFAGAEFIFTDKENLKITVSICVSEKTRKDLNASEVISRAHDTLQKANALNSNICMKA